MSRPLMDLVTTVDGLRDRLGALPHRVFVPTMGALHEGHLRLCDRARELAGPEGSVLVSIFVNPTQFGPGEDYTAYPRSLEADLERCRDRGVDLVFAPAPTEMYASDASITISESRLSRDLCGADRPGHFDGVCTVVAKLFLLTRPESAVFGEKDYQQLLVIRRMVRDLHIPVSVVGCPTVREDDGLALSSRNAYLSGEERRQASAIYRSLCEVRDAIGAGRIRTGAEAEAELAQGILRSPLARIDYARVLDPSTLEPVDQLCPPHFRLFAAVRFGRTRLIDNLGA